MTAIFRINQAGITGGKPTVGDWDKARADLDLFSVGGVVSFVAQDASTNYLWEVISEMEGSAITLGTPTAQTATANITVTGGYLLRLTTDEGLPTKDIRERYFGVPLPGSGLPIPALNETIQDNRDTVNPGYERKMTAWMKSIDASVGGGGVFEEPGGPTLSTLRIDSGATILADYAFASGALNIIDADSHFTFVYGGDTSVGSANEVVNSEYATVFGRNNTIENAHHSLALGLSNDIFGTHNYVMGQANAIGESGTDADYCFVAGTSNTILGGDTVVLGHSHQPDLVASSNALFGNFSLARWPGSLYHAMNPYLISNRAGQVILCTHLSIGTTDDTPDIMEIASAEGTKLTLDLNDKTVYLCELHLIARTPDITLDPSALKTWVVCFTAHRDADSNSVLLPIDKTVINATALSGEASWDVSVAVNMAPPETPIEISVVGAIGDNLRWYGVLHTTYFEDTDLAPV